MTACGVALVGFMGAGKSTIGRALAERLGWGFVDLDRALEERHGPIAAQIAADGIAAFRDRERDLATALCGPAPDGRPRVVATGGGTWVDPVARAALERAYHTVHLDVPLEVAGARVGAGGGRPLWDGDVAVRYADRRPIYRLARSTVPADRDVDAVVRAILVGMARTVTVTAGSGPYPVAIAPTVVGLADHVPARAVVVTETTVGPLWAAAVSAELGDRVIATLVAPAGEARKDLASWSQLVDGLLAAEVDRDTAVVALGGGVLGDVAGFAAATALRGLPVVQVPTTLLAMVDSSVGGKVAVNHRSGKNRIGVFHPPIAVWAALETLDTLPAAEIRAGWGEIVKTAIAADAELFEALDAGLAVRARDDRGALAEVIARVVRAKAAIVSADERDTGLRLVLNAGHTVAHGLEGALGPGTLRHGEAVAIGLVAEAAYAVRAGVCRDPELPGRVVRLFARLGIATAMPSIDAELVGAAMGLDKKARADKIRIPLPVQAGEMVLVDLPRTSVRDLLGPPITGSAAEPG